MSNGYAKRREETLKQLGTLGSEWTACSVNTFGLIYNKTRTKKIYVPNYLVPAGYSHEQTGYSYEKNFQCELCSHDMIYSYYIKHDERKIYIIVGSTCVTHFDIKAFVNKEFKSWREKNIPTEWKDIFLPGIQEARRFFVEKGYTLPDNMNDDREFNTIIRNSYSVPQKVTTIEKYSWLLDALDESEVLTNDKDIAKVWNEFCPKKELKMKIMAA